LKCSGLIIPEQPVAVTIIWALLHASSTVDTSYPEKKKKRKNYVGTL